MIIIKTTNGDHFVNEKEVVDVAHNKENREVGYYGHKGIFNTIKNVESVTFISDTQAIVWKDEGSEVERLKEEIKDQEKKYSESMNWGKKMREKFLELEKENDELKSEVEKLRNLVKTMEGMKATSEPKQKISLRATSPIGSDCTQAFDVDGCDGMTVKDFILNVIKNDPYVTIAFMRDDKYIWHAEFTKQELQKERSKNLPDGMYAMKVKSARASGGWGQMSYHVNLYDTDK